MTTTPEVLFVCVHNAGRSQMAAALLEHRAGGRVHVKSAGSEPAYRVDPAGVEVMSEIGLDVSKEFPEKLLTEDVAGSDVVITTSPGKRDEDWALADPAGRGVDEVRKIPDGTDLRVRTSLAQLTSK